MLKEREILKLIKRGGKKLWVKIHGDETAEPNIWKTKFREKTLEIEIWDRNCRNELTGGKLRE